MLKKILLLVILPLLLISGGFYYHLLKQADISREAPVLGIQNGKLLPCPDSPNCVNSEFPEEVYYVEPIPFPKNNQNPATLKEKLKILVILNNGNLIDEGEYYLRFAFITPMMKYFDDVEFRIDPKNKLIHIRSASRVGHSDMGANQERYQQLRSSITQSLE